MSYVDKLRILPYNVRNILRRLEGTQRKIVKCKWSLVFNNTCLSENILPNYTNIRYHDPALAETHNALNYKKSLVKREVELKQINLSELESEEKVIIEEFQKVSFGESRVTKPEILHLLQELIDNANHIQKTKSLKKLNDLYHGQICVKDEINCLCVHELFYDINY